ncbi:hypothetical protein D030_5483A, partial [Vibrio parahaemolyticus AQ3810]
MGVYTMQVNTEIEYQYDSFDFKLLPLDLSIWLRFSSCKL